MKLSARPASGDRVGSERADVTSGRLSAARGRDAENRDRLQRRLAAGGFSTGILQRPADHGQRGGAALFELGGRFFHVFRRAALQVVQGGVEVHLGDRFRPLDPRHPAEEVAQPAASAT